jgi:hypothetical protein
LAHVDGTEANATLMAHSLPELWWGEPTQ